MRPWLALILVVLPGVMSGCALPRNQTEVMHGKVLGGKVPLYQTGSLVEFFRAGLVVPDVGGYARTEFDVFNIGRDGRFSSASGGGEASQGTVAQVALPRRVSSYDLSRSNCEMRAAVPADGKGADTGGMIAAAPGAVPRSGAPSAMPRVPEGKRQPPPEVVPANDKAARFVSAPAVAAADVAVTKGAPAAESRAEAVKPPGRVSHSGATGMDGLWAAAVPASGLRGEGGESVEVAGAKGGVRTLSESQAGTQGPWAVEHFLNAAEVR